MSQAQRFQGNHFQGEGDQFSSKPKVIKPHSKYREPIKEEPK